jgi:hypothetical protein
MCCHYTKSHWLFVGIEPYSPLSQSSALPTPHQVRGKQHLMFGLDSPPDRTGREPISSESKSDMLAIALPNKFAVRKGVEPLSSDRQSVMLAVTPTNLFCIVDIPQFCGRTCSLSNPNGVSNPAVLRENTVASHRERSHSSSCIYYFIAFLLLKTISIPL